MKQAAFLFFLLFGIPAFGANFDSGYDKGPLLADDVKTRTGNFDGYLSGADTDVQKALDTLDDLIIPAGYTNADAQAATGWTDGGMNVYLTTTTDNVGIGTTIPERKFVVRNSTSDAAIRAYGLGTGGYATYGIIDWFHRTSGVQLGSLTDDNTGVAGGFYLYGNSVDSQYLGEWGLIDRSLSGDKRAGMLQLVDDTVNGSYGFNFYTGQPGAEGDYVFRTYGNHNATFLKKVYIGGDEDVPGAQLEVTPSGGGCSGTAAACATFSSTGSCNAQAGCSATVSGDCSTLPDEGSCVAQSECTAAYDTCGWDEGAGDCYDQGAATGCDAWDSTDQTTCQEAQFYSSCSGNYFSSCGGTATTCSAIVTEGSCTSQSGCSWASSLAGRFNGDVYITGNTGMGINPATNKLHVVNSVSSGGDWPQILMENTSEYFSGFGIKNPSGRWNINMLDNSYGLPLVFNHDGVSAYPLRMETGGNIGLHWSTNSALAPVNGATIDGNASIGSGYYQTTAPTNGLIVQGNVGIGEPAPIYNLEIVNSSGNATIGLSAVTSSHYGGMFFGSQDYARYFQFVSWPTGVSPGRFGINSGGDVNEILSVSATNGFLLGTHGNQQMILGTNSANRMVILGGGNVGIGTVSPVSLFEVGARKLNVTSAGNVGLGTVSPQTILEVKSADANTNATMAFANSTHAKFLSFASGRTGFGPTMFWTSSDNLRFGTISTYPLTGFTETQRWEANGNVGIGTTVIDAQLVVTQVDAGDSFKVEDVLGDTSPFIINQAGNVGIGTATSASSLTIKGSGASNATNSIIVTNSSNTALFKVGDSGNIAGGDGATSTGTQGSVALGTNSAASSSGAFAAGNGAAASVSGAFALGNSASAAGDQSNAIGFSASTTSGGDQGTAIGRSSRVAGVDGLAVGSRADASGVGDSALGWATQTNANYAVMLGSGLSDGTRIVNSTANTVGIGNNSTVPSLIVHGGAGSAGTFGNVGIGLTGVPTAQLLVEEIGANDSFRVNDEASDTTPFIIDQTGSVGIGTSGANGGRLIVSGGNVGIGTANPRTALDLGTGAISVGIGTTTVGTLICVKSIENSRAVLGYCTGTLTNSICGTCN